MPPPGIGTPVSPSGGTSNSVGRRRWRRGISVGDRDRDRRGMGGRRSRLRLLSRRDRSSSLRSLRRRMRGGGGGKGKVSGGPRERFGQGRVRFVRMRDMRDTRDPVDDRRVDESREPPIVQHASFSPARKGTYHSRSRRSSLYLSSRRSYRAPDMAEAECAFRGRPYPRGASSDLEQPQSAPKEFGEEADWRRTSSGRRGGFSLVVTSEEKLESQIWRGTHNDARDARVTSQDGHRGGARRRDARAQEKAGPRRAGGRRLSEPALRRRRLAC